MSLGWSTTTAIYLQMTDEVMQWQKRVRRLVYMVPVMNCAEWGWYTGPPPGTDHVLPMRIVDTYQWSWVWAQLACDLNIESLRNKMMPRRCQSRSPCRPLTWRWSEQYLNIQDNGTWMAWKGIPMVSLIKQYLPTENRGMNSGANNSLQSESL
jgi:hypothetical protein